MEVMSQSFRQSILRQNLLCVNHGQDYISCKKINSLMSAYHILYDAVHEANNFYSDQLLVSTFCSSSILTECLYFFLVDCMTGYNIGMISIGSWIILNAIFLMLVALSGSNVTEAAGETTSLIRKLISQDVSSETREHLKSFLLQLFNKDVGFSASGFFQINRHILTSIAAAVTTYLVIIIQFDT
ncbi:putative gustatory receptor 28b [Homalodisca vitripennis]|uniref:putative gustatory receptor 28b n=1 Tax=Homalodisca vitripennis TaxID=197043 RepID=UPI001EE9F84A|nr:putative gustatory receptor 28b [Homalodisca vitripennis]